MLWQANRIIWRETRLSESRNTAIQGCSAWQAQNTDKETRRAPARNSSSSETPSASAAHSSSSLLKNHMLYSSLSPSTATRAVHTLHTAAKVLSSPMSSATLDLGAEAQLSDKKAVRKRLHSLLSELPSDLVQRQCPSLVVASRLL